MSRTVTNNPDGTITTTIRDDITGTIDLVHTRREDSENPGNFFLLYALDYDLTDQEPWFSYEHEYDLYNSTTVQTKAKIVWDDGGSYTHEQFYFGALANSAQNYRDITTSTAANGNVDYVYDVYGGPIPPTGPISSEYASRSLDYDSLTGNLDYSRTITRAGNRVDIDYDARDGSVLYVATFFREEGHTLGQLYTGGRLDYETEIFANGRIIATDYDLNDEHPWTWTKVTYSSANVLESVVIG